MKGIDVSDLNGQIDWQAVKDVGIGFAMVQCSFGKTGRNDDFAANVTGAQAVGLKVGAYHYSYALTPEDAIREAQNCREVIDEAGVALDLPVFFDMEDADKYKEEHDFDFSPKNITAICRIFLGSLGLDCGVYASYSWLSEYIDWQDLGCSVWNAQWGDNDDIKGYMWQFTDSFNINGQNFDGDILYE